MVGAEPCPLDQAPEVLNRVGVDDPTRVLDRVVDGLVQVRFAHPVIAAVLVGDQQGSIGFDVRFYELVQPRRVQLLRLRRPRNHSAAALDHANDRGLVGSPATLRFLVILALVPLPRTAAYVGLIRFDDAVQKSRLLLIVGHRNANTVHHRPDRLTSDAEVTGRLATGDAFLGVQHQREQYKPIAQRDVGSVEDRSHGHSERPRAL